MKNLNVLTTGSQSFTLRIQEMDGINYLIAPVVMMVEGVHSGSGGAKLFTADELSKFPEAWNGVPVTVQHPTMEDGTPISANSPQVIETQAIGKVFNAHWDGRLRGEAWVNPAKAERVVGGLQVLQYLRSGGELQLQVSVGHWDDTIPGTGTFNEEEYAGTVTNIRPDHLALLPGGTGACSWTDGCGIRANKEGEPVTINKEQIEALKKQGFVVMELAHEEVESALRQKVDSWDRRDGPGAPVIHYLVRTYDNTFIYERQTRGESPQLFKLSYTKTNDDVVVSEDTPVEVKRDAITFSPVTNNEQTTTSNTETKGEPMISICDIITNKGNKFTEDDRVFLQTLSAEQLEKFASVEVETPTDNAQAASAAQDDATSSSEDTTDTTDAALNVNAQTSPVTMESLLANANPELVETIAEGQNSLREAKAKLISVITGNTANPYTPEELQGMKLTGLKKLAQLAQSTTPTVPAQEFGGRPYPTDNAGNLTGNAVDVIKPMEAPVITFEK